MNNEPVAWMQTYKNEPNNIAWTKKDLEELGKSIDYSYIPLYTHPVKELTDEEILLEAYYILMREQQRKAQEK